jgi:hypothetical protein
MHSLHRPPLEGARTLSAPFASKNPLACQVLIQVNRLISLEYFRIFIRVCLWHRPKSQERRLCGMPWLAGAFQQSVTLPVPVVDTILPEISYIAALERVRHGHGIQHSPPCKSFCRRAGRGCRPLIVGVENYEAGARVVALCRALDAHASRCCPWTCRGARRRSLMPGQKKT